VGYPGGGSMEFTDGRCVGCSVEFSLGGGASFSLERKVGRGKGGKFGRENGGKLGGLGLTGFCFVGGKVEVFGRIVGR